MMTGVLCEALSMDSFGFGTVQKKGVLTRPAYILWVERAQKRTFIWATPCFCGRFSNMED